MNGLVRHAVYDDYAANARIRRRGVRGTAPAKSSAESFGPVILRLVSRFYRQVIFGGAITIKIRLIGLSSNASRQKENHVIISPKLVRDELEGGATLALSEVGSNPAIPKTNLIPRDLSLPLCLTFSGETGKSVGWWCQWGRGAGSSPRGWSVHERQRSCGIQ